MPLLGLGTDTQRLHGSVVYSRDQLIALRLAGLSARTSEITTEIWRKTHRMQGRTETEEGKRWVATAEACGEEEIDLCLPSFIMGDMRSLANKAIELAEFVRSQREYQEFSLMCLWRHGCTKAYLTTTVPSLAFRLFWLTGIAPRAVNVKEGDLLFSSTTAGVILVTLT